jgi:hypothetical protein
MAFDVLNEAAVKDAIDFARAMIKNFLSEILVRNFEEELSVFTERVSGQNWNALTQKARV